MLTDVQLGTLYNLKRGRGYRAIVGRNGDHHSAETPAHARIELTKPTKRVILIPIIPLSSFGERAQDRSARSGPCLFLKPA